MTPQTSQLSVTLSSSSGRRPADIRMHSEPSFCPGNLNTSEGSPSAACQVPCTKPLPSVLPMQVPLYLRFGEEETRLEGPGEPSRCSGYGPPVVLALSSATYRLGVTGGGGGDPWHWLPPPCSEP